MPESQVSFGPFTLSEAHGLSRAGKPIEIGQKALSILWELAKADGQSISKARLLETCWPGMIVEDGNLTVQIAALRKALGQTDDGLDWIVTVPRLGYRLPKKETTVTPLAARSLAVLPFKNLSTDTENEYFAASLAAEITSALAKYKSLSVQSAATQLAQELGVAYVVEGSAMKSSDRLRIVVSLIGFVNGSVIWNRRFDATMADIFAVQDEIAATVASHVDSAISDSEIERARRKPPANLSVYEMYLRAAHLELLGTKEAVHEAFALLQEALRQEPLNARVMGAISELLLIPQNGSVPPLTSDDRKLGEYYARRCIELADGDARVLARAAAVLLHVTDDYPGTLAVAEQAYKMNPNDWDVANVAGTVLLHGGDIDVAIERYERAIRLGPASPDTRYSRTGLAHAMLVTGQYEKAIACASDAIAVNTGFDCTYWMLIAANAHLGRMDAAKKWLSLFLEKWPGVTVASIRAGQPKFKPERIEPILQGLALAGMPEG